MITPARWADAPWVRAGLGKPQAGSARRLDRRHRPARFRVHAVKERQRFAAPGSWHERAGSVARGNGHNCAPASLAGFKSSRPSIWLGRPSETLHQTHGKVSNIAGNPLLLEDSSPQKPSLAGSADASWPGRTHCSGLLAETRRVPGRSGSSIVLGEVMTGISALEAGEIETGAVSIVQALNAYGEHFEHPGWQALD